MKQKYLYVVAAAVAIFVFSAIVLQQWQAQILLKNQRNNMVTDAVVATPPEESITPSIESMNGRPNEGMKASHAEPTSLAQIYSQYPAEDTGNNMVASWAKVSPEEKTKAIEQLDQQITEAKEALNINPADKKAKHILFISETLKSMCKNNFNFNLLETIPQDQGGLKPRSKK